MQDGWSGRGFLGSVKTQVEGKQVCSSADAKDAGWRGVCVCVWWGVLEERHLCPGSARARRLVERRFKSSPPGVKPAAGNFVAAEKSKKLKPHAAQEGSHKAGKQSKVPARPHHLPPSPKCAVHLLRALSLPLSLLLLSRSPSLSFPPSPTPPSSAFLWN